MQLTGLFIHPVKSLRGVAVTSAEVDSLGLVGDRRFMVVHPSGTFLTQRSVPRMALVDALLDPKWLTLRSDGFGKIRVQRAPDAAATLLTVQVWASVGLQAEDCGDEPAAWLTGALKTPCRLVRIGPGFDRPVRPDYARPGDRMAFVDGYPFLVISEASLVDLNRRIAASGSVPVPMNRFRPNLVLGGCDPYAEDAWVRVRIGGVEFRRTKPCTRCIITTTDQLTGVRGVEPLRTLAGYRRDPEDPTDVDFGQNLVHETKSGVLRVGDSVEMLD